jgi:hypothetical protein
LASSTDLVMTPCFLLCRNGIMDVWVRQVQYRHRRREQIMFVRCRTSVREMGAYADTAGKFPVPSK